MANETESQRLTKMIEEKGLSVYAFAKDIGVKVQLVQNWVKRDSIPKKMIVEVADYFGVTTDFLLKGE
jgi:plasmid maintenance system antidote protein VapI